MENNRDLEVRLAAMRTFLALLLAELEQADLIDRPALEKTFWEIQGRAFEGENKHADLHSIHRDMGTVFAIADHVQSRPAAWRSQLGLDRESRNGSPHD